MENTPYLDDTLLGVLGQQSKWLDLRHRLLGSHPATGPAPSLSVCIGGKRAAPLEDCGGPWAYLPLYGASRQFQESQKRNGQ